MSSGTGASSSESQAGAAAVSAGPSSGSTGSTGFTDSTGGQANAPQAQQVVSGVIDFPLPGHKSAPKKFKGKHSDVIPFIHFYEQLCIK